MLIVAKILKPIPRLVPEVHKNLPLDLSQMNPFHTLAHYFLWIHFNISRYSVGACHRSGGQTQASSYMAPVSILVKFVMD
jgi:hypothetical protein